MPLFNLTGKDTLTLFGRVITNLAEGTVSTIVFPNDLVTVRTGKNQNTIFAKNEMGNNADLTLRLMRASSDDNFLLPLLNSLNGDDFASFVLSSGIFVKRLGDGAGNVTRDVYNLNGGIFTRPVDVQENVEGEVEQAVAVYRLKFALAVRGIQ